MHGMVCYVFNNARKRLKLPILGDTLEEHSVSYAYDSLGL